MLNWTKANKQAKGKITKERRTVGQWFADMWTVILALVVAMIALAENAWAGSRMLMMSGATWYEGAGIVGTLDAMMVIAAVRMRRKGISRTQVNISRAAMWYGLAVSACTNVLSALVYKGIVDVAEAGAWIIVAYSPVAVVTLWFVVEMLTHQDKSKAQSAFPLVSKANKPKPDSKCTPAELAKRQKDRARRARLAEIKKLEAQVSA